MTKEVSMEYLQFLYLIPITLMAGWIRVLSGRIDTMKDTTFSKTETTEMIELHQRPLIVQMDNIEKSCTEIKSMLQRVLDDK